MVLSLLSSNKSEQERERKVIVRQKCDRVEKSDLVYRYDYYRIFRTMSANYYEINCSRTWYDINNEQDKNNINPSHFFKLWRFSN
jgi:hypothetical protein